LYACPELVTAVLEPDPTRKKAVLDLGQCEALPGSNRPFSTFLPHLGWCSSGVWYAVLSSTSPVNHSNLAHTTQFFLYRAAEVALENPHVLVLGLDIVPHKIKTVPPNCQFDLQDMNLGLSKYYNMFDVVHMRNVAPTVSTPSFLIPCPPFLSHAHLSPSLSLLLPYSCVIMQYRSKKLSGAFALVASF